MGKSKLDGSGTAALAALYLTLVVVVQLENFDTTRFETQASLAPTPVRQSESSKVTLPDFQRRDDIVVADMVPDICPTNTTRCLER